MSIKLNLKHKKHRSGWHRFFYGTRTRILGWCIVLIAFSEILSIVAIRQALFVRLERRVQRSLLQEVEEFRRLFNDGRNPLTGQLFGDDIDSLFKVFLSRNIPNDDEFLLAIVNGEIDRSSPRAIPNFLRGNSKIVKQWAQSTQPMRGEALTPDGQMLYITEPVKVRGEVRGVFVVAHFTTGEHEEVDEAVLVVIQVTVGVLVVASVLAWGVAGRVLAPLQLLTETARDITESDLTRRIPVKGADEIAELSATFNEMLDRLEAAFASQRNFVDDVGHELRTPITIVRGYLELLQHDVPEHRETIELVTDELDRMSRFVNDLLLLAKTEQPDFLNLDLVDIDSLSDELYDKAKHLAERDWRLETKGTGRIVGDRQRITQAIINLAQNATQHTNKGDQIALGSVLTNGKARFWVRDTGVGIAPDEQKRIFERFARTCNSRSDGAGLGLAIVRAIAQAHGGSVELYSRPGIGSTFTLVLPLEPPQEVLLNESDSHS